MGGWLIGMASFSERMQANGNRTSHQQVHMEYPESIACAFQSIGEFVVAFQWVEDMYRQIGWFILDPNRTSWPPMALRREKNEKLINTVTDVFVDLVARYEFPNGPERAADLVELRDHFHEMRKYRNRLLHSTFVEFKAGEELAGYMRSNPKITVDPDSGELVFDQEALSADAIYAKVAEYGDAAVRLGGHYLQLIHWSPFEQFSRKC